MNALLFSQCGNKLVLINLIIVIVATHSHGTFYKNNVPKIIHGLYGDNVTPLHHTSEERVTEQVFNWCTTKTNEICTLCWNAYSVFSQPRTTLLMPLTVSVFQCTLADFKFNNCSYSNAWHSFPHPGHFCFGNKHCAHRLINNSGLWDAYRYWVTWKFLT